MNNPFEIWAKSARNADKSNITLFQHTNDVLKVFDKLYEYLKEINRKVLENPLPDIIRLSILLHDLGKVHPAFQIKKLGNTNYRPFEVIDEIPHSLFSLFWINIPRLKEKIFEHAGNSEKEGEALFRFVLSTVAFHHWRESFNDFLASNNYIFSKLKYKSNDWWEAQETNLKSELATLGSNGTLANEFISKNKTWIEGISNDIKLSDYVTPPYQLYYLPNRIGLSQEELKTWVLISGFTMLADHFASYCEEEQLTVDKTEVEIESLSLDEIKTRIVDAIKEKKPSFKENDLWQSETAKNFSDRNTILIAPTGFGKTEFAWLWSKGEKFFYTLPLRSAVNQNYDRTKKIFGNSKSGILHSDADVYLLGDGGETDNLKIYDLARQLAHPAIVSTGDQFFPYALRPPGYEKIFAKFSYSRLIIDEVQAYDPKASAIVVKYLEHIDFMGGKFLLMTATLPEFIKSEICNRIPEFKDDESNILDLYKNEEEKFGNTIKHRVELKIIDNTVKKRKPDFRSETVYLKEVIESAKRGNRVLVILNTIAQAQFVYDNLKNIAEGLLKEKIWLLHSRFTLNKRKKIEREVVEQEFSNPKPKNEAEGKILVSTQVVEASLDMDADVMFTEVAALDSLVQRMGRVLRRKRSDEQGDHAANQPNIYIWIFKHGIESGNGYVYHKELLAMTLKILTDKAQDKNTVNYEKWLQEYEYLKLSISSDKQPKGKKKRKKDEKDSTPIYIKQQSSFSLSEFDKYNLLTRFYKLPEESDYLKEFYQTLDILDAGYISDRKNEAQKIFREISDILVIPEGEGQQLKKEFVKDIAHFFDKGYEPKGLYARFKSEILSKYVVQVQWYKVQDHIVQWNEAFEQIKFDFDDFPIVDTQFQKLERWLRGIYIINIDYDDNKGLDVDKTVRRKTEDQFI